MSPPTETIVTFFTNFSATIHSRTTVELAVAHLNMVRIDADATLAERIGVLIDSVVDDSLRLCVVMHALRTQSARQLSRSNCARWRRLRQTVADSLCAKLNLVLGACNYPPQLMSDKDWREAARRLSSLTRLIAGLYVDGLVDAQVVHHCFNRLISGWLNPNTWQPMVDQQRRCGGCDDASLECAMHLLVMTGQLLQRDDRGGDEQRRLRARVPHYFDVVLTRVGVKLGARHRLSSVVKRVRIAKRHFT